jgi:hypothetical protein
MQKVQFHRYPPSLLGIITPLPLGGGAGGGVFTPLPLGGGAGGGVITPLPLGGGAGGGVLTVKKTTN